jgi:hypothetical protein
MADFFSGELLRSSGLGGTAKSQTQETDKRALNRSQSPL